MSASEGNSGIPAELLYLFERSDALQAAADLALVEEHLPSSRRGFLSASIGAVSMEHWGSQRLLLKAGFHVTGMALVRLQFEAVIRTVWILHCAKEDWLDRFVTPVPEGQAEEPVLGPPVESMLVGIAKEAPVIGKMLSELKEGAWKPMHSYVHGGARPIAHAIAGATPYQISAVLRNANGLGLIALNAFTIASQHPQLRGFVGRLQQQFSDCLPPSIQ